MAAPTTGLFRAARCDGRPDSAGLSAPHSNGLPVWAQQDGATPKLRPEVCQEHQRSCRAATHQPLPHGRRHPSFWGGSFLTRRGLSPPRGSAARLASTAHVASACTARHFQSEVVDMRIPGGSAGRPLLHACRADTANRGPDRSLLVHTVPGGAPCGIRQLATLLGYG